MKRIITVFLVVLMLLPLFGCGSDPIIGVWETYSAAVPGGDVLIGSSRETASNPYIFPQEEKEFLTFSADGTFFMEDREGERISGTWKRTRRVEVSPSLLPQSDDSTSDRFKGKSYLLSYKYEDDGVEMTHEVPFYYEVERDRLYTSFESSGQPFQPWTTVIDHIRVK